MKRMMLGMMALLLVGALSLSRCMAKADALRVTFFDVGKADAMLITTPEGLHILIDAATNKEGEKLAKRLVSEGITRLDAMIITHFDKDHVGGADKMLEALTVDAVILPTYEKDSKQYGQFLEALQNSPHTQVKRMETDAKLFADIEPGLSMSITSAQEDFYGSDEENDFSLVVRMEYGRMMFIFAGDAENARQQELLAEGNLACDVLKVPYHGRYEKSSPAFLAACAPQIAFIPDADDDPADARVIELLRQSGAQVYCAKDGEITVASDGDRVFVE